MVNDILKDLQWVGEILFPRRIVYNSIDFHASSKAYGTVVYVVDRISESSNILFSKARVAPWQAGILTIPKLELTATIVGCWLLNHLNSLFSACSFYLWSDSKVALSWIQRT